MKEHGYPLARIRECEEDHVVPLCLAGAPQDPANLWPQPRFGEWSADRKNRLEAKLCQLVCDGRVLLAEAQREIATDWIAAYRKYIGRGSRESATRKGSVQSVATRRAALAIGAVLRRRDVAFR